MKKFFLHAQMNPVLYLNFPYHNLIKVQKKNKTSEDFKLTKTWIMFKNIISKNEDETVVVNIQEMCKRFKVSARTLRFYESKN